jgi:hypothetical protein
VDIERWFAVESPKEMSESFAEISAIYYVMQVARPSTAVRRAIESRLGTIVDQSEWFAASMCLEAVASQQSFACVELSGASGQEQESNG